MEKICLEQLTIYRLTPEEFEDAALKNECLAQTRTERIGYLRENAGLSALELADVCQRLSADRQICAVMPGPEAQERELDYGGAFSLVAERLDALAFPKKLTARTGPFNAGLGALTNVEFLCRAAMETGLYLWMRAEGSLEISDPETTQEASDQAYACAYMLRRHLQRLHALGLTERILSFLGEKMQEKGVFSAFKESMDLFMSDENAYERIAGYTAPFLVLKGNDICAGALRQFADDLCEGLAEAGQAVIRVDSGFDGYDSLKDCQVFKGIVGFQAPALNIDFFKKLHGPKYQFLFDCPPYLSSLFENLSDDYWFLCQDGDYAAMIPRYFHADGAVWFPPGGREPQNRSRERIYDIVFVGSYFKDDGESLTGEAKNFYDYMLARPRLPLEEGYRKFLEEQGFVPDDGTFLNSLIAMKPVRRALIAHFRNAVVSTILEAGFTLHVYGDSWQDYPGPGKERLAMHPQVAAKDAPEELSRAKIGLNVMSWHKAGMTERVANIMLSGAVCLTEGTTYLREHMKDGEEIVCFELDRLSELPGKIAWLLEHPAQRGRIAASAYEKAKAEHTWKCRAMQLTTLAEKGISQ